MWFLGRIHSSPQWSFAQMELCSSSSLALSYSSILALERGKNSAQLFISFFLASWHTSLQGIKLLKVICQVQPLPHWPCISPVDSRWILRQSSQCGYKGLIPRLQGINSGLLVSGYDLSKGYSVNAYQRKFLPSHLNILH